jgi:CBS domain-containing protein
MSPPPHDLSTARPDKFTGQEHLDLEVRDIMTPGIVTISEEASLRDAARALVVHRIHAVLVVGERSRTLLGWVTARGLLDWALRDADMAVARDGITHEPITIDPSATVRQALTALEQPAISQLIVASGPHRTPHGVLSDLDVIALLDR